MKKIIKIGLIGLGNVGSGVVECLKKNNALIKQRTGFDLEIVGIAVRNLESKRLVDVDKNLLTTDAMSLVNNPNIDIIAELAGGTDAAAEYVLATLNSGKIAVTANKALLAEKGEEIFAAAVKNHSGIFFEASVAGGIPVIKALGEGLVANEIYSVYGILNGTCNYILTRMELEGIAFDKVLKEAQELGYAEAEPSMDIDGIDTAHKLIILATMAFGKCFCVESVYLEGIRDMDAVDIDFAKELGYRIKLIAIIEKDENGAVQLSAQPTLIPVGSLLGKVNHVLNAVMVNADMTAETMYYGPGAGKDATASAVVADIIDACKSLNNNADAAKGFSPYDNTLKLSPKDSLASRFYIRLLVEDKPKTLAEVAGVLGHHDISIAHVNQKDRETKYTPVVLVTHKAPAWKMNEAVESLTSLGILETKPVVYRIKDLD